MTSRVNKTKSNRNNNNNNNKHQPTGLSMTRLGGNLFRRYWRQLILVAAAILSLILLLSVDHHGGVRIALSGVLVDRGGDSSRPSSSFDRSPDPLVNPLTFDDPVKYSGAVIEGWKPGVDRNMNRYILPEENTVVNDISCLAVPESAKILIVVQSAPEMLERRKVNRETWMVGVADTLKSDVSVVFLFGVPAVANRTLSEMLSAEQKEHCDVIQMDFVDHYSNVTIDTVMALKFYLGLKSKPEFLVIADDDTYVNVPSLWEKLFVVDPPVLHWNDSKVWGKGIGGEVHFPEKDKFSHLQILPYDKWTYTPSYLYNKSSYPQFLSGSGYVLPYSTVRCLYKASLMLPYFHINDIYLTGFAREMCSLGLVSDDKHFFPDSVAPSEWSVDAVVYHHLTEKTKMLLHQVLVMQNGSVKDCGAGRLCYKKGWLVKCPESGKKKCERVLFAK